MKNENNFILKMLIVVAIVVIILLLLGIKLINNNDNKETLTNSNDIQSENIVEDLDENTTEEQEEDIEFDGRDMYLSKETDESTFSSINDVVSKYLENISNKRMNSIYNVLDDEYIQNNNITTKNVLDKIEKIEDFSDYHAVDIYTHDDYSYINPVTWYYVYGVANSKQYKNGQPIYSIVKVDWDNEVFCITPILDLQQDNFTDYINSIIDNFEQASDETDNITDEENDYEERNLKELNDDNKLTMEYWE